MRFYKIIFLVIFVLRFYSCKSQSSNIKLVIQQQISQGQDTVFVNLKEYSSDFVYDIKYATDATFLNAKVYDCPACYMRLKTVKALIKANKDFEKRGFKIKIWDCYRPLDVQIKMWKIVPDPRYVADPNKGSIHNRGGAVDVTLVDKYGKELDMGTVFDFFGKEASHKYLNLPKNILLNRRLLKRIMVANGFKSLNSEWWHYDLKTAIADPISNAKWSCD